MSTTKAIALVDKKDYMLQQTQIVVKASGKQIEYLVRAKYAITRFHPIELMMVFVNDTIYRNVSHQGYETSLCIITTKLRSCS